ncbi:MAG: response regulator [Deltaproteobacteria bacterium]|nr:response regulator [Deltaproteobacteria bacterium]
MKINLLVVDDEKEFGDVLSKRLQLQGFEVATVFNGEEAVQMVQKQDFDVVILDVLMPGKSGIDTLKEIKKIKPLIQIIMLTGHARIDTAIEGIELGAYDYLIKPTEIKELVEKIRLAKTHKTAIGEQIRRAQTRGTVERYGLDKWVGSISGLLRKRGRKKTDSDL